MKIVKICGEKKNWIWMWKVLSPNTLLITINKKVG